MLQVRVSAPSALADGAEEILRDGTSLVSLSRERGASLDPEGDVLVAVLDSQQASAALNDINDVVQRLNELGISQEGCILIQDPGTWVSRRALKIEQRSPDADNVVWPEVVEQAYEQSKISPMFLAFMVMATIYFLVNTLNFSIFIFHRIGGYCMH